MGITGNIRQIRKSLSISEVGEDASLCKREKSYTYRDWSEGTEKELQEKKKKKKKQQGREISAPYLPKTLRSRSYEKEKNKGT